MRIVPLASFEPACEAGRSFVNVTAEHERIELNIMSVKRGLRCGRFQGAS